MNINRAELLDVVYRFYPRGVPNFSRRHVPPGGIEVQSKLEAATCELEALTAAWDDNGAPPDAMVAWASSFLASWDADEEREGRGD